MMIGIHQFQFSVSVFLLLVSALLIEIDRVEYFW